MATAQEIVVQRCLELFHSTEIPDLAQVAQLFTDDASYQVLVPRFAPRQGLEAILGELTRQFGRYKECECEVLAMASSERFVFTERRDHVTLLDSGKRIYSCVNAVFELNDDNRIVRWREYWDSFDIAQQLGLTPEQFHQRMEGDRA